MEDEKYNEKMVEEIKYWMEAAHYGTLKRSLKPKDKVKITFVLTNPKIIDLFLELIKQKEFKIYSAQGRCDLDNSQIELEVADKEE